MERSVSNQAPFLPERRYGRPPTGYDVGAVSASTVPSFSRCHGSVDTVRDTSVGQYHVFGGRVQGL